MDLSALGTRSLGLWTRPQAQELLSPHQVDSLVRDGSWQVPWRGVYADGGVVLTAEQRAVAAVLASGGTVAAAVADIGEDEDCPQAGAPRSEVVAAGRTAARVWCMPLIDDADPATGAQDDRHEDVVTPLRLPALRHGGRTLHRRRRGFGHGDVLQLASGLWLTSPLRTLADCAELLSHQALVCAVDDALRRGLVTLEDLERAARSRKRRPGAPALRAAVAVADRRSESPGETLLRLVLLPVLPGLVPQVRVRDAAGRVVRRYDLADERLRLGLEFDGRAGHAGAAMVAKDRRRDRTSDALGWTTERFTWWDTRCRPDVVRRQALAAAARLR